MDAINDTNNHSENICKNNYGALNACKSCSGFMCCGTIGEGNSIEPPFLTKYDIKKIKYHTGLPENEFVEKKINQVTGNRISLMKTNNNDGCVFFSRDDGKCQIYSLRPTDCRLFPLDIEIKGSEYYWSLFKYKECSLDNADLKIQMEFKNKALEILAEDLHDYATYPVPGMEKIGYKTLMKI